MPHGSRNNRGFHPGPPRGRGRGRGRGFRGFRGVSHGAGGREGELEEFGEGTLVFEGNFRDFTLGHIIPPHKKRSTSPSRSRGGYQTPSREDHQTPHVDHKTFRGGFQAPRRGFQSPRRGGKMRGIGFLVPGGLRSQSHLSISVLERNRPLLRPIVFVQGQNQKTLFQEVEEILHAPGEEGGPIENHAPSAGVVERLFKADLSTKPEEISTTADKESSSTSQDEASLAEKAAVEQIATPFIVDMTPSPIVLDVEPHESAVDPSVAGCAPLGQSVVQEEVIVYVAPHPRTGSNTLTIPSPTSLSSPKPLSGFPEPSNLLAQPAIFDSQPSVMTSISDTSLTLPSPTIMQSDRALQAHARTRYGLKPTPRSRKIAKKERAAARRRAERESMFGTAGLGLGNEEIKALHHPSAATTDPRKAERRLGDSDVDWGTDDDELEDVRSVLGDMELDPELPGIREFAQFARGVQGLGEGEVVTIADLEDATRMEEEDEEDGDNSSDQEDGVFDHEERREIGESSGTDNSVSSDEGSPKGRFRTRLKRMREKAKGKAVVSSESPSSGEEDGLSAQGFSWADRDESFLEGIEDLLDENDDVLRGRDRKARNAIFTAIKDGEFGFENLNMRKKDRIIPSHLQDQWNRDRAKKVERKRQRALGRTEAVAEYSMRKTRGKKEKIFGSARFQGDTLYSISISDLATLERQIRTFLHDLELKTMVLPPKGKEWRRRAHLLAEAFSLKSRSKGKGEDRFITLIKTTRSGVGINERKVSHLVNGNRGEGVSTPQRRGVPTRNREGDEVGKMAPKISEANVGFKLLQQMGWEEGDRIGGVTGGLVDPLTAIIKNTKLGLGATR